MREFVFSRLVNHVAAGGHAAFALQGVTKSDTRKGQVLIDINSNPQVSFVLSH
jgi:hypothetical protein